MFAALLALGLGPLLSAPPQAVTESAAAEPTPPAARAVFVENQGTALRREVVRVSLPFAPGVVVGDARRVEVGGEQVPAVTLVRWPDGSAAVLQAHVPVELAPGERRGLRVDPVPAAVAHRRWGSHGDWPRTAELPLYTEVEDPWGQVYTARLELDAELTELSSALVRVQRFVGVHARGPARFLGLVAYLVTTRGSPRAELTMVLDNGAHLPAVNLGPVRLRAFRLVTTDDSLRFWPRLAGENAIPPAVPRTASDGAAAPGFRQDLLGPSTEIYLGDRTAKAFRFELYLGEEAAARLEEESAAAAAAAREPRLIAWPDLAWLRRSGAFGAHGGPAPAADVQLGDKAWRAWRRRGRFGPFTGHGDPEDAAVQGTARNGPSAMHNVLRWRSVDLFEAAETAVLQQGLRPTPGHEPRRPSAMASFRQGLSPTMVARPHRFTALDYEHFSVDLLYDYYWLTGDPLARAELRRAGDGLRRLLAGVPFLTSRGEGWCLQAGVLIARATGDDALTAFLLERARTRILPEIGEPSSLVAIAQPPHNAFGPGHPFDAPWQMAALVHGLHALFRQTGDRAVAAAAVRTAHVMAAAGWLEGKGPKYLVSARAPGRYIMPVGFEPMEGTAPMEIGAFVLAAEMTERQTDRALFERRAEAIAAAHDTRDGAVRADRWFQLYLDRGPEVWREAR